MPGPGNYDGDLNLIGKNAPMLSIRGKVPRQDGTLGPGPGAYSENLSPVKPNQPGIRLGSSERKTQFSGLNSNPKEAEYVPGPGMYNP